MPSIYLLLFSLYWAQGLPVGFMTHALPVILRSEGVSLTHIGGFGLLMLPWSLKILWAPWVDRRGPYRTWLICMQLSSVALLTFLAFFPIQALNQPRYLMLFFVLLLSINTVAATQDIATDGLAVQQLKTQQQHWGNTLQVIGSRIGFIFGGGAVLWALEFYTWQSTFLALAGLVLLNTLPILATKPKQRVHTQPFKPSWQAFKQYIYYFQTSAELKAWLWVLLTFKVADGLAGPVLKPLMVDIGLSLGQIGLYITMFGAIAALCGALLAGLLLKWLPRAQALLLFSVVKIFSFVGYAWLAMQVQQGDVIVPYWIYVLNAFDDALSSMLLVVMLTLVMQYSRQQHAGTDFTLQVAVMATVSGALYTVSGMLADQLGYAHYLWVISLLAVICMIALVRWAKCYSHL